MKVHPVNALHQLRRLYWRVVKPKTFGVKVAVFNSDRTEVLLVRHCYGSAALMLPGGAIERGEDPRSAAAREVREELGLDLDHIELCHTYFSAAEGKRDTVHLFSASYQGHLKVDPTEIREASFYSLLSPPLDSSPATLRRLRELRSGSFANTW